MTKYEKIFEDFPEFFKHRENLRASLMAFGFECGEGWIPLIYKLCGDIKPHYDAMPQIGQDRFYVQQVKEKFGGLRFYTSHLINDEVSGLVSKAEDASLKICELCGEAGTMHTNNISGGFGWLQTLCPVCAEKKEYVKLNEAER